MPVIRQEPARKGHMFTSSSVRAVVLMFKGDADTAVFCDT